MNTDVGIHENTKATPLEPCFRLIYRSRSLLPADPQLSEAGLAEILRTARTNNRQLGITGALVLYEHKNWFAQALEGPEAEVTNLFDRIKKDPRHKDVEIREAESVPARLFSKWAMALVAEHGEPDEPLVATSGGISEAAPWQITKEQELVLTQLRDMTRAYGRSY